jgi:glycosyltransferase involved in cell wall biosynthesis
MNKGLISLCHPFTIPMQVSNHDTIAIPHIQEHGDEAPYGQSYPLRVGYDAQAFLSPNGGTGKGSQLRNLLGPYSDRFVGFATKGQNHSDWPLIQGGLSRYQIWQQISLPYLLHKWGADFFLAPYNTAPLLLPKRTRLILVLHDLILLERFDAPSLRQRVNNEYRRFLIPRAVSRAHTVLTVSSYSKQRITERFPFARVEVIPCSLPPSWFVDGKVRSLDERENCILSVTGDVPHKNPNGALEGYAAYVAKLDRATAPRLRLVGLSDAAAAFRRRADALQIGDLVHIEPYLSESQLQDLYRRSRAVLVPSLMEGFGIPVLEAMASGTPVIASDATSLPEVGGPAASYFNPHDVADMAATLRRVLGSRPKQQKMIDLGLSQARRFHPDEVGRQVRAFWNNLQASGPRGIS